MHLVVLLNNCRIVSYKQEGPPRNLRAPRREKSGGEVPEPYETSSGSDPPDVIGHPSGKRTSHSFQ